MAYGQLKNKAGKFITPSVPAFQADAATANWKEFPDFYQVITDAPGPNAYPLTATTFVLMYKHPKDSKASAEALKFFKWSLEKGQPAAAKLDYVSLPAPLVKQIEQYWTAEIK
jgi:phosphate transport system substrate-binding protein